MPSIYSSQFEYRPLRDPKADIRLVVLESGLTQQARTTFNVGFFNIVTNSPIPMKHCRILGVLPTSPRLYISIERLWRFARTYGGH